jgi:predicted RNase H-like nuclease
MTDRADLYIPFFEKSLSLLNDGGKLSFICTDRWIKNIYGTSLRKLISEKYSLELFLDIYGANAFDSDVMTYPAITQISKTESDRTVLITESSFTHREALEALEAINGKSSKIQARKGIVDGGRPWLIIAIEQKTLIRKLEHKYPALEEAGCKVYIGAATGANKVYVVDVKNVDIEKSRLLPVITANELKSGTIQWSGKYIINTYDKSGIINLEKYPRLAKYLNQHKELLCSRHVAKLDAAKWFKTIDRVYEERARLEKLLIPDISSDPVVIYDKGQFHPNNSIYYISSDNWNLHALRVVLLSGVTKLFISSYSTKIANGYLRFQAQHLRKLRLPLWSCVEDKLKEKMIEAGMSNNIASFTELACEMYGLNKKEIKIVGD